MISNKYPDKINGILPFNGFLLDIFFSVEFSYSLFLSFSEFVSLLILLFLEFSNFKPKELNDSILFPSLFELFIFSLLFVPLEIKFDLFFIISGSLFSLFSLSLILSSSSISSSDILFSNSILYFIVLLLFI